MVAYFAVPRTAFNAAKSETFAELLRFLRHTNYGEQGVIYEIDDDIILVTVVSVGHRKDIYK
jgi:mRNA-degrading endonuclease RelE of RelBE toxin-antitoxin system